jgi:hypothetical protein
MSKRMNHWMSLACWLGLAGLALVVWSVLDPRPVPVLLAMTAGQVLGTVSLGLFALTVYVDLRRHGVLAEPHPRRRSTDHLPPSPES